MHYRSIIHGIRKQHENQGKNSSPWATFNQFRDVWHGRVSESTPYRTLRNHWSDYLSGTQVSVNAFISILFPL